MFATVDHFSSTDIAEFVKMQEAKQVGLYFLVSGDSKDELYI